ncbi:MAG: hypothetical protein IJ783_07700, partial [Kiritimatiellae bacterium]|nr:hypothetical protein [Kiritimatiellia bacterium]
MEKRIWPLLLFLFAAFATGLAFCTVWPQTLVLGGPDGMPDLSLPGFARRVLLWTVRGDAAICHDSVLKMLLPTLDWHETGLCVSVALEAAAAAVFMRQWGLPVPACCCGGLAFAFAGYNFTLFAAGHRGMFSMTPYAALSFALVERALRRPRVSSFALLALCVVAGLGHQPDVMALYGMLLAAYVLFRLVSAPLRAPGGARAWWRARRRGFACG